LLLHGVAQNTLTQRMDTLTGIENLSGTPFADTLTGDDSANWLWGSAATIAVGNVSATNNDIVDGKGGDDLITVGIGNQNVQGGTGIDTLRFTENGAAESNFFLNLNIVGGASQNTGNGMWKIAGFENVSAGQMDDQIIGDGIGNVLAGEGGDDFINGNGGDDVLLGDGMINVNSASS